MRILQIITKRQLRGAEIFALQLSLEMKKSGHDILFVALQAPASFPEMEGIQIIDLNLDPAKRFSSFREWKAFATLVRQWKPDVIQANASETLKFCVFSKKLFRWKTPIAYRNANKVSDFIHDRLSKIFNRWLASNVDLVISVSENCRVDYVSTFEVDEAKTVTIPIGTIVQEKMPEIVAPFSFPYFVNIGSLVPEKNHLRLLEIFSQYKRSGGVRHLVIVGDGKERKHLEAFLARSEWKDQVHLLGYRKDAMNILRAADALLLPSLIEGLPGVILEAMISSTPVVAYAVGGIPEIIIDQKTGFLVNKDDEKSFLEAILLLEGSKSLRDEVVRAAYEVCKEYYDIKSISKRFLETFSTLVKSNS